MTLILKLIMWLLPRKQKLGDNRMIIFIDTKLLRVYLGGFEKTVKPTYRTKQGVRLGIVLRCFRDCTGGFKASRSWYLPIAQSYTNRFAGGYFWRNWSLICSYLKMRFWYVS
jgi:hypothetical protein